MDQFKTLEDLREYIKRIDKFYARPTVSGEHSTLYIDSNTNGVIHGVRKQDYLFHQMNNGLLQQILWVYHSLLIGNI